MTRFAALLCLALALSCARARAAEPSPVPSPTSSPVSTIEVGASDQSLTNGHENWKSDYIAATHTFAPREVIYANETKDYEFGLQDQTYLLGGYLPVGTNTTVNVEASDSPTHAFDPQDQVEASIEQRFADGWGVNVGVRDRVYNSFDNNIGVGIGTVIVDRYWKRFRIAYTVTGAQLTNTPGTSVSQDVLVTNYYGYDGENSATLSVFGGRDVENTGVSIVASAVNGESLNGINWFSRRFGITWMASTLRQGNYYTRSGVQIGVRNRF